MQSKLSSFTPVAPVSNADYCFRAIALKGRIETEFLGLGEMLQAIRDNEMYLGSWTNFEEFCAEMDFSESRASKLISVYQFFVKEMQTEVKLLLNAGGWANLYELYELSKGKDANFVNETLVTLGTPTIGGRQKLLRQMKKGIEPMDCPHSDFYILKCCRTCGDRLREYPSEAQNTP